VDCYAVMRIPKHLLGHEPLELQQAVLAWAVSATGSGEQAERAQIEALRVWISQGQPSRRSISGSIVSARRHVIEFMREPGRLRERPQIVPDSGKMVFDGRFEVVAPAGAQVSPVGAKSTLKRPKDVPALAFSALPMVRLADGKAFCAVNSGRSEISANLCERFRP
jgi:hypothetical protein